MGQYWLLLNVDKRQTGQGVSGKFPEFIFNGHSWLVRLLARPGPEFNEPVPAYYVSPPSSDKTELGSLSRIPMELIAAIFSSISSSDDAVCLAAAHRVLAPEGFRRLLELRREECRYWGSWAGDRLITSGDYARTPPAGMLLPAEAEELGEATLFDYAYYAYEHYEQSPPLFRDLFYMHQGEKIATKVTWQRVSKEDQPGDHLRVSCLWNATAWRYPAHSNWALCNLRLKHYIPASALVDVRGQSGCTVEGAFLTGKGVLVDLGALAIIMTAWSDDVVQVGRRGPWAGDRLEITIVDDSLTSEGWVDVSQVGLQVIGWCLECNDRWLPRYH